MILAILVILIAVSYFNFSSPSGNESNDSLNSRLQSKRLEYSKHARCRMECREISKEEINAILESGKVNQRKSDPDNSRCPRYALEGPTEDGQTVRIIFADCEKETVVVTAIDLSEDHKCYCP